MSRTSHPAAQGVAAGPLSILCSLQGHSAPISRTGRACVPRSRGIRAMLLLLLITVPSRVHCPLAVLDPHG